MTASFASSNRASRLARLRWTAVAGALHAVACNGVLGIEEAELRCSAATCADAGRLRTERDPLGGDAAGLARDAGRRDASVLPAVSGSGGTELTAEPAFVPNAGGGAGSGGGNAGESDGDGQQDDDSSGSGGSGGSGSGGSNSGAGGAASGGGSSGPPSPCRDRAQGEAFCDGSIRISCGQDGSVTAAVPCPTSALCEASQGGACAACLPGEARCNGEIRMFCNAALTGFDTERCASAALCSASGCATPFCAASEAHCRGARLERCNADRTAFDVSECGSPQLCNESAGRCNACLPNAARCEDTSTAAVCDSAGNAETFIPCRPLLEACRGGQCVLLGVDL